MANDPNEVPVEFVISFLSERGRIEWDLAVSKAENALLREKLSAHEAVEKEE